MVLTTCTWCNEVADRSIKGDTSRLVFGEMVYGVCSWCKTNDMPMPCAVCRDIYTVCNMLKTRNEHNKGKFIFCCKKEVCVGKMKEKLHLLKK
jgi:hypothetical protein